MLKRLLKSRAAKVSMMGIIVLVLSIYVAAFTLPAAINQWIGNGTVIGSGGTPNATLNTLWVTVGGIVIVAIVLIAFLRSR